MPYLEIKKDAENTEEIEQVEVPNIEGKNVNEATKILKEVGLELKIDNEQVEINKENTIVKEQTPKSGIKVNKGSAIYCTY